MACTDHRTFKRFHSAKIVRGIPRRLSGDGTNGRQFVSGDTNGFGPREDELFAIPDAVRHQTLTFGRNYT